eukprot:3973650-Pleurochrysis_carterae.AAC.1
MLSTSLARARPSISPFFTQSSFRRVPAADRSCHRAEAAPPRRPSLRSGQARRAAFASICSNAALYVNT